MECSEVMAGFFCIGLTKECNIKLKNAVEVVIFRIMCANCRFITCKVTFATILLFACYIFAHFST